MRFLNLVLIVPDNLGVLGTTLGVGVFGPSEPTALPETAPALAPAIVPAIVPAVSPNILGLANNEELDALLTFRSGPEFVDESIHPTHAQLEESLWFRKEELIPFSAYTAARADTQVGCAGGFCKRNRVPPILKPNVRGSVTIHLSDTLYYFDKTAVYGIAELPDAVIKYFAWCWDEKEPNDSIVTEAFFMEKLARLQLAPRVYYYSDYLGYDIGFKRYIGEFDGRWAKLQSTRCPRYGYPAVRYMIMERVGDSLIQYMNENIRKKTMTLLNAVKLGAQMVGFLRKLHSLNIVHGDAHLGNYVRKSNGKLLMIDFARSKLSETLVEDVCTAGRRQRYYNFSWWEMLNCKTAFRDDVYRAIQNVGFLLHGEKLGKYMDDGHFETIKMKAEFFEFEGVTLESIPTGAGGRRKVNFRKLRSSFAKLSEIATVSPIPWYGKPDYDAILAILREIIFEIRPSLKEKYESLSGERKYEVFRI
jgi:hypothetical protein